ncbi:uncharacterized protein BT62DRAFT_1074735 [Guyanagaster necrorhizus]|uniref:Fungal-type protein kinase domain-containing protein n=1 Tax=Guyanagaster necrorhizus TaxID=856835 RepID=A0A9P7VWY1_9AGAR|nr:uncharacterized protein BT62DRAFT_1074735 [Guyanagaster necrorhizus MCA 3950]KAG7448240.1 hypothetical protein BT62DRAFT_1074735 [Guyanagaster necrorhizus MCA 3950]
MSSIHEIPEVALDNFKETYLPRVVNATQVEEIAIRLQKADILLSNGRWADFPNDPADAPTEDATFHLLDSVAAAIVKEATVLLKCRPTATMQTNPRQSAISEGRNAQFISDGHYKLCISLGARVVPNENATKYGGLCPYDKNSKVALAYDRIEIEEYKCKDRWTDENDNNKKILGNVAQMMYADPYRRFMFSATITNTTTRLWYFSRAFVLISTTFDFIYDYKHLIHYVISMSFGSLEDLGYDTSTVRIAIPIDNGEKYRIQYDYLIGDEVCRTVEVWRVRKLSDANGQAFALKDVWIPLDPASEIDIQKRIFHLIDEQSAQTDPSLYKKFFMDFGTCNVASAGKAITGNCQQYPTPGYLYTSRKHGCVLFSELGIPLDKEYDQSKFIGGLLHAFKGLRYLYVSDHIHPDISSGNVPFVTTIKARCLFNFVNRSLDPSWDSETCFPRYLSSSNPRVHTALCLLYEGGVIQICHSVTSKRVPSARLPPRQMSLSLVDAYQSVEASKDFPAHQSFDQFFSTSRKKFEKYLESLAQSTVGKIRPWKDFDSVEEGEIDWAVTTGLEEANYADTDSSEADCSINYVTVKWKRSVALHKVGEPVDDDQVTVHQSISSGVGDLAALPLNILRDVPPDLVAKLQDLGTVEA